MTAKEIIEKLKKYNLYPPELTGRYWETAEQWDLPIPEENVTDLLNREFGEVKQVYSHGGYEGAGDNVSYAYHFIDHNVYLRIDGYYSSWESTDWVNNSDGFYEVEPEERKVIFYEKKEN